MCICAFTKPCHRNEQFQEELWKRSFEFLKDHLSPESVEKYSLPPLPRDTPTATREESSTQEPQGGATEVTGDTVTAETVE